MKKVRLNLIISRSIRLKIEDLRYLRIPVVLTCGFSGESQDGLTHSFVLTFFWDERTGTPYDAKMWLVYNHGDIRFEIKFADENVTGGHVPVTLEISNFERDIEKKEIAFDFHMKIDPAQTTLKLVTTITGAMKFKNYGDP